MSNKTQLQTNNAALDTLITRVNAAKDTAASLPEAGGSGGGSVETCTVTINPGKFGVDSGIFYYTDNNMNIQHTEYTNSAVLTVAKNTLIYIEGWSSYNTFSGSCTNLFFLQGKAVFTINGDCEFNFDT